MTYGPEQVRVNVILPGAVRTNIADNYEHADVRKYMESRAPLRRIGEPEDTPIAPCTWSPTSRGL